MAWKLVFRGALADGVTPKQAAAALAEHFGQRADIVEQRVFGGGAVRVKVVETKDEARRFAARFAEAGVELDIEPMAADSTPPPAAPPRKRQPRSNARLALAGMAAVLLAAAAAGAWYAWPVVRGAAASPARAAATRALATADLIGLAHLDVARAMQLQRRLVGAPDPDALMTDEEGLWQSLVRAGIDPAERIDDVVAGVYAHEGRAAWAAVVLGRVPRELLRDWLEARFDVERFDTATGTTYFSWLDAATCEPGPLHAARLGESSIVIARAELVERLGRRFDDAAPAEVGIKEFLTRTERQVLSVGVFNPSDVGRTAGGLAGMMLAQAGRAAAPAEAVYLGAAPTLMPPGVVLSGTLASADADFLSRAHEAVSTWLESAKAGAAGAGPAVADLYERIDVSRETGTMTARVRLDTDLDDELRRLVDATLGPAFNVSAGLSGGAAATGEQLDEHPVRFAGASADELESFETFGSGIFEPQWQEGPFAVAVSRLGRTEDGRVRIALQAEGRGLPNLGARSELARLRVVDVTDVAGRSLLPARECGPARNRDWTSDAMIGEGNTFEGTEIVRFPKVTLDKTLTLAGGSTRAADVAAIRGEIEYRLPSEVRSTRLEAPLAGRVFEHGSLRVHFEPAPERTLKYQASGETARLLAVRALNAEGQVLATGGSTSGQNWLGGGEHASVSVRGDVAAAEIVVAEAFEPLHYEFELPGAYPPIGADTPLVAPAPELARPAALTSALELVPPPVEFPHFEPMATTSAGPALVAVRDLQAGSFWGLLARIELYVPEATALARQLNGASLALDRVERADGAAVDLGASALVTLEHDGAHWFNGEYRAGDDKPWLAGSAQLQASDYEGDVPARLHGRVVLRAVEQAREASLGAMPGGRWHGDGVEITVIEWHRSSLSLGIPAGGERILSVTALDGSGAVVGRAERIDASSDGHSATISLGAVPETLRVAYATAADERELPFSIDVPR